MNWQAMLYFFSFGTLIASILGGVFVPFCRRREFSEAPQPLPRPAARRDSDRVARAMRNWRSGRAQADLAAAALRTPAPVETPAPHLAPPPCLEPGEKSEIQPVTPPQSPSVSLAAEPGAAVPESAPVPEAGPLMDTTEPPRSAEEPAPYLDGDLKNAPNFYEILQISPRADLETIHRVYRIMAARFHPDNPVSGDHERFLELCQAYETLSQPDRRAEYDCILRAQETQPMPIFEMRVFVDGLQGEVNRRFGILALLYQKRRLNPAAPGVSTLELERRMSLPREHLEFTLWYLRSKSYLHIMEDNSDYAITAAGIDYVERHLPHNPIVRELLKSAHPEVRHAPAAKARRRTRESRRRDDRTGAIVLAG